MTERMKNIVVGAAVFCVAMLGLSWWQEVRLEQALTARAPAPAAPAPVPAADPRIQTLVGKVAALEQLAARIEAVERRAVPPADLDARLQALTAASAAGQQLAARVEAVERRPAPPADLDARVQALAGRLTALDGLNTSLQQVTARLDSLQERPVPPADLPTRLQGIAGSLAAMENRFVPVSDLARVDGELRRLATRVESTPAPPPLADIAMVDNRLQEIVKRLVSLEGRPAAPSAGITTVADVLTRTIRKEEIRFAFDSAELEPGARAVLAAFAGRVRASGEKVAILGYADRVGNAAYNDRLSLRRAVAVRDVLMEAGVADSAILAISGLGYGALQVQTPQGVAEGRNRVVHIRSFN